MLIIAAGG